MSILLYSFYFLFGFLVFVPYISGGWCDLWSSLESLSKFRVGLVAVSFYRVQQEVSVLLLVWPEPGHLEFEQTGVAKF